LYAASQLAIRLGYGVSSKHNSYDEYNEDIRLQLARFSVKEYLTS